MLTVTKNLLTKAFQGKSLAALYVDLQDMDYASYDAHTPGSKHKAYTNCESLRACFNAASVENMWVMSPYDLIENIQQPYYEPARSVIDYNAHYSGTNAEFRIVSPSPRDMVFPKRFINGFDNIALSPYIKEKNYNTLIMGGVSAGSLRVDGCLSATIKGALASDPTLNIVVMLDGTNLEDEFIPERTFMRQFLDDVSPRDVQSYLVGNDHNSRVHYAHTQGVIRHINQRSNQPA